MSPALEQAKCEKSQILVALFIYLIKTSKFHHLNYEYLPHSFILEHG